MAKIDYSKVEHEMHEALQKMRVQSLIEGKPVTSKRAEDFFGLSEETQRPSPQEPVAKLVRVEAATIEEEEKEKELQKDLPPGQTQPTTQKKVSFDIPEEPEFLVIKKIPDYDELLKARKESARPPRFNVPPPGNPQPADAFLEKASPLYILRQHILWLKRRHCDNRYEMLGTTRDEIMSLRKTKRLNDTQLARIKEINNRAEEVKASLLAVEGITSEDAQVEKAQKQHKNKRFRTKDSWLPL